MADTRFAVIENGTVVNVILAPDDFELEGITLVASEAAQIGDSYSGGVFNPPEEEEPLPPPPSPVLIASGTFQVSGGDVTYAGHPAGIGFALQVGTGVFWLFFSETQPDTAYSVYAGSSQGLVNYTDRQLDYFELSVSDLSTGTPIDPSEFSINVTVTRAI